jgi:LysM repeat protein
MLRNLLIILFFILSTGAMAQDSDSLFAIRKGANWAIRYTVKPGETAHMLAVRFYISDGVLEYANDVDVMKRLSPGTPVRIPVTKENFTITKLPLDGMRELYFHVGPKDDIGIVSTYSGVTKSQIRTWNNLKGNTVVPGEPLFVGWVKMMARDSSNPASEQAYPPMIKKVADPAKVVVPGGLDTAFNRQTNNGSNVLTEKGTAVFFEKPGKNNVFYAFHNSSVRGSIIKVTNPGTGKTIYVKVLGPIPDTKLYANSIIGICNSAKEALGVGDNKAWVELSYSPN